MLLIPCPWCGERAEIEFAYGGEAHLVRPPEPGALDDADWADYVFMRSNRKGPMLERWVHAHGCGRWFNAARDTVSYRILSTYRIGEMPPSTDGVTGLQRDNARLERDILEENADG